MQKLIHKAYKFRIYPNKKQAQLIQQTFGCCRFVYNDALGSHMGKDMYSIVEELRQNGTLAENNWKGGYFNKFKASKELPSLKKHYPWLNDVDSNALIAEMANLEAAYKKMYSKQGGRPHFKKRSDHKSYTGQVPSVYAKAEKLPDSDKWLWEKYVVDVDKGAIKIAKLGWVKAKIHRKLACIRIYGMTVSQDASGRYYCSLKTEVLVETSAHQERAVGIDMGLADFAITSDETKFSNPRFYQKLEWKLAREQRKLSKKEKGSRSYEKQKRRVAKLHARIADSRQLFIHETSKKLVSAYDIICLEDLDTKSLMQKKMPGIRKKQAQSMHKQIADVSWHEFKRCLTYKADWAGKELHFVGRYFPSSQICSTCGHSDGKKELQVRVWKCSECGTIHDRDINAAKNILTEGLRIRNGLVE